MQHSMNTTSCNQLAQLSKSVRRTQNVPEESTCSPTTRTLFVSMSGDERFLSVLCGCDCELQGPLVGDAGCEDGWARCDCVRCGGGRCSILVSPVAKAGWLVHKRGRTPMTLQEIEASPRYCGDCIDHHHLEIKQNAVHRARRKRKTSGSLSWPDKKASSICMQ